MNSNVSDAFSRQNGPSFPAFRTRRSKRTFTPAVAAHTDTVLSKLVPERTYSAALLSSLSFPSAPSKVHPVPLSSPTSTPFTSRPTLYVATVGPPATEAWYE